MMQTSIPPPLAIAALPRAVPVRSEQPVSEAHFVETIESDEGFASAETAEMPATAPPPGEAVVAALTVILDLPEERLTRTLRYLEQADFQGLITHFFVLRAFFPDAIAGADDGVQQKLDKLREALRATLDRLFIKLRLPRYALTAKDLEDGASRSALRDLLEVVSSGGVRPTALPAPAGVRISGTIDAAALAASLPLLEAAPLGSVVPWLALVPLVGSTIERAGTHHPELGRYRDALASALNSVAPLPLTEFHRVLISSTNASLDETLRDVVKVLGQSLEVTTPVGDRV
jgi:hypothetical protein